MNSLLFSVISGLCRGPEARIEGDGRANAGRGGGLSGEAGSDDRGSEAKEGRRTGGACSPPHTRTHLRMLSEDGLLMTTGVVSKAGKTCAYLNVPSWLVSFYDC